jgi:lipid-binding SYLF domain-containing protein
MFWTRHGFLNMAGRALDGSRVIEQNEVRVSHVQVEVIRAAALSGRLTNVTEADLPHEI